jgi:ribosomal protein S6--L-glutamate ligase
LIGQTVEAGLREHDITALSLHRQGTVIPNPRGSRIIELGDRLLCYGKLEAMRAMLPPRPKRRRRPKTAPPARG